MLYKNVSPMMRRRTTSLPSADNQTEEDIRDMAALRALGGLFCSACDKPLQPSIGKQPYENGMTCCGRAHCPYCGASDKERCSHLFAYRTSGHWCIAGLPEIQDTGIPEPPSVIAGRLLDYDEAQKQEAFGSAYPLLRTVYGPGFLKPQSDAISAGDIIRLVMRPDDEQRVKDNYFFFTANPEPGIQRMVSALKDGLSKGFERLLAQPPATAHLIVKELAVDTFINETQEPIKAVAFSPDGKHLVALAEDKGIVYSAEGNYGTSYSFVPDSRRLMATYDHVEYSYCIFSLDSRHFIAHRARVFDSTPPSFEPFSTEVRDSKTGDLLTSTSEYSEFTGRLYNRGVQLRDEFLHAGDTFLTVRNRTMNLYSTGDGDTPLLSTTFRLPISRCAVAPDGETFAVVTGPFVTILRIPRSTVIKE